MPHLIDDYDADERIWVRARPFLIGVLLVETSLAFSDRFTGIAQGLMVVLSVSMLIGALAVFNRIQRRRLFDVPQEVKIPELVFFVVTPALIALVVSGDPLVTSISAMIGNALLLAVTYVVVGFGLIPMIGWAVGKLIEHLIVLVRLMARTLPVLLVLTVFMFINAEIWQVAYTVDPPAFLVVSLLLALIGFTFLWFSTTQMLDRVRSLDDWAQVEALASDALGADADLLDELDTSPAPPGAVLDTLRRGAVLNLRILLMTGVATQVVLVGLLVFGFYVLIGLVLISPDVLSQWTAADDLHLIGERTVGPIDLALTREHIRVSGLIGALAGLNIAVSALSDESYRQAFTADLVVEIEENLAVRAIYGQLDATE